MDTQNYDVVSKYFDLVQNEIKKLISEDKEIKRNQIELFNNEIFNQPDEIRNQIHTYIDNASANNLDLKKVAKQIYDKFKLQVKNNIFNQKDSQNVPNKLLGEKHIKRFEGFFSKDKKSSISQEDLTKSKFYHMIFPSPYKDELITKTIDTINLKNEININKDYINDVVLFIARILRNYDHMPSDKQFNLEFNHFLNLNEGSHFHSMGQIDEILEKIKASGYESLSDSERAILLNYSKDDEDIHNIILKMNDLTKEFIKLKKKTEVITHKDSEEVRKKVMKEWLTLNSKMSHYENMLRYLYQIEDVRDLWSYQQKHNIFPENDH